MRIERQFTQQTVTIASGAHHSDEFYFAPYTFLSVEMPSAWDSADIGFEVSRTSGGTFVPLYDEHGNVVRIDGPSTDQMHSAPAEVAGQMYVRLWSEDGSGGDTNQTADRELGLVMKG